MSAKDTAGFWTRRRARVAAEQEAEARARLDAAAAAEDARRQAAQSQKSDAEILAELDLPDPAELLPGQDIAAFMHKAVPEHLRRAALRRLWRLNPRLAVLDGLNDYDTDFTNAATDAPGVKTAYRVGKGLLRHVEALARDEDNKNFPEMEISAEICANSGESAVMTQDVQVAGVSATASATKVVVSEPAGDEKSEEYEADPLRPRRMRFTFETETE